MKNEISVIITCYNEKEYISNAIESVLNQTSIQSVKEIIIVDDGSTDNSKCVIDKYINTENKLDYIFQENRGLAAARNTGIRNSNGQYIALLDGDDVWKKNKLEKQIRVLDKYPDIGLTYTDFYLVKDSMEIKHRVFANSYKYNDKDILKQFFINGGPIVPSTVIINRKCLNNIGLFDKELLMGQDTDLWIRIATSYHIHHINEPLIFKRDRSDSLGANTEEKINYLIYITKKNIRLYPELKEYENDRMSGIISKLALHYLEKGFNIRAIKKALKSLKYSINNYRAYLYLLFAILPIPQKCLKKLYNFVRIVKSKIISIYK